MPRFDETLAAASEPSEKLTRPQVEEAAPSAETDDPAQSPLDEAQEQAEATPIDADTPSSSTEQPSKSEPDAAAEQLQTEPQPESSARLEQPLTIQGLNRLLLSGLHPGPAPSRLGSTVPDQTPAPNARSTREREPAQASDSRSHPPAPESSASKEDTAQCDTPREAESAAAQTAESAPGRTATERRDPSDAEPPSKSLPPLESATRSPSLPPQPAAAAVLPAATPKAVTASSRAESLPAIGAPSAASRLRWIGGAPPNQPTAPAAPQSDVESAFAAQLSRGLTAAMARKDGSVTLRIEPEHLGHLRIQVGMKGGSVTAQFEASTPQARDLLGKSMAMLKSSLEARGLEVDRLHVQVAVRPEAPAATSPHPAPGAVDPEPAWNAAQQAPFWSDAGTGGHAGSQSEQHQGDAERSHASSESWSDDGESPPRPGPTDRSFADARLYLGIDTLA
ncbi:MAG: flagellar hook-length control protein FliK [Phycisphaeraceae bacterium]|nr:flagellar hook-length control protein FliK [Phycisphaeraceae bacterium]